MFGDDPCRDAFKAAAEATRARIRRDRARAPKVLKKVFTVVAARLFHPSLNATSAWKAAGVRDRALGAVFKALTEVSLSRYIAAARIEVAHVLMAITDLDLASISERVGYTYYATFTENYRRLKRRLPSEVPRERLPPPLIDDETSLEAGRGLLDAAAVVRYVEDLLRIYPTAAKPIHIGACPDPEPQIIVDGARGDRLEAEDLWRKIRDLPFAEQCRRVRRFLFRTTVLFDLLRKVSRWEGRKSRRRGVEVAELALISLEGSDRVFGERIHDLRALGWAWLGNAHRLALDFSSAAAAFERADREWSTPRPQRDLSVLAHICCLEGLLRMMRREYGAATELLDRSCSLFQQSDQARDEALALIHRARIHIYTDEPSEAVEDLREAAGLIDEDEERRLAFAIRGNLANAMALAGQSESAAKELDRARQLNRAMDDPLGTPKLDWIDGLIGENHGDLERAKSFYQGARAGFRDAGEPRYFGLVSVDLMIVHSLQDDWERVGVLAAKTLPILSSQSLHSETVAAVGLLAEAVEVGGLSRRLLNELRVALRQDPLAM
ncbi:MAG: AraC family transcriptional regulator [bacterium]|nr:AraC family transcriptional regulator [bacterium]